MGLNTEDIVGKKIGSLTVLRYVGKRPLNKYLYADWNEHELYHKYSVVCDCKERQILKRGYLLSRKNCNICVIRNLKIKKKKKKTSTYKTWLEIKNKCHLHKKSYYKDNNIKFCKRWLNYRNFLKDMGKKKDGERLVRKDKTKNFSKSNCEWATFKDSAKRKRNCYLIKINRKSNTLRAWFKHFGLTINQYTHYVRSGYKKKSLREKFNLKSTDTCSLLIKLRKKY